MFDDVQSVILERGYYAWLKGGQKSTESKTIVGFPYFVDFLFMKLCSLEGGK